METVISDEESIVFPAVVVLKGSESRWPSLAALDAVLCKRGIKHAIPASVPGAPIVLEFSTEELMGGKP